MKKKLDDLKASYETHARQFWDSQLNDIKTYHFWRSSMAEFVGVLWLVLFIIGSGCARPDSGPVPTVQSALGIMCTLTVIIASTFNLSGAHLNPAISIMLALTNRITVVHCVVNSFCQCLGAVCAMLLLQQVFPSSMTSNLGVLKPAKDVTCAQAFCIEIILGFSIGFACLSMFDPRRTDNWGTLPFMFGLCVSSNYMFTAGVTPVSMNPAFSVGPMVVFGDIEYQWIYILGPTLGICFGAVVYDLIFCEDTSDKWDKILFKRDNKKPPDDEKGRLVVPTYNTMTDVSNIKRPEIYYI